MSSLTAPWRPRWLRERQSGIGGSDVGAILGLSPYGSPFEVWLDKTGAGPEQDAATEAMEWGIRLEDAVAEKWEEVHGLHADRVVNEDGSPRIARHPDYPFMIASLDRWVADGNPLEVKTASAWSSGWDLDVDVVPDYVRLQQQHQIAVTDARRCYGAVLIGGQRFRTWVTERDDALIADLVEAESRFWHEHVLANVPPPIDGSAATSEAIKALWPESDGTEVELPSGASELVTAWRQAKEAQAVAAADVDRFANQIKALLGDAECGRIHGARAVTWKSFTKNAYTVEASTQRPLKLVKGWKP